MQNSNRRFFSPLFALALVTGLALVACGSGGDAVAGDDAPDATSGSMAEQVAASSKPLRVAQGQRIDIADYAVEGSITVFDFMSDYCPPCKQIGPWLDRLHAERDDVKVVKIDINRPGVRGIDWKSPTLAQYGISSIPHFKIYGADGELMEEGRPAYERIVGWLRELPPPAQAGR